MPSRWAELMTPWDDPHSAADGILDDETYDWLGVLRRRASLRRSGRSSRRSRRSSRPTPWAPPPASPVSPTGTAGLAGLLTPDGAPAPGERVAVIFSGASR